LRIVAKRLGKTAVELFNATSGSKTFQREEYYVGLCLNSSKLSGKNKGAAGSDLQ
jgi:hypothetical protein